MFHRDGYNLAIVENHAEVTDMLAPYSVGIAIQQHRELRVDSLNVFAELEDLRDAALEIALVIDHRFLEDRETAQSLGVRSRRLAHGTFGYRLVPELGFRRRSDDDSALFRIPRHRMARSRPYGWHNRRCEAGLEACSGSRDLPCEAQCVWKPDVQNA
ncbi:hypothetical protein D3C87_1444160 [compost metagenome]